MAESLADRLRQRIRESGPISVSAFVEAALYDPDGGFYSTGGRAGRRGDFLTAPEVGPLFGAVIARAIDAWWRELGRPDVMPVFDWGAGPGTLARSVIDASPAVLEAGALRWCAIERSQSQRSLHPDHPAVISAPSSVEARIGADLGDGPLSGVVVANELLDNLPFDVVARDADRWVPRRVAVDGSELVLVDAPFDPMIDAALSPLVPQAAKGATVPWQPAAREWLVQAKAELVSGRIVVLDYGASSADLAGRGGWLRTHRDHDDSSEWLADPGSCDITADVAIDQLQLDSAAQSVCSQADFLRLHGIDELVEDGRAAWEAAAHVGDLAALKARSRIREAETLLDPEGMGGFQVLEWVF